MKNEQTHAGVAQPSGPAASESSSGAPPWWFIGGCIGLFIVMALVLLVLGVRQRSKRGGGAEAPCRKCGRVMLAGWTACKFCGTSVAVAAPLGHAELQFISGPLGGRIVRLETDVTTIGSAQGNNIVITDNGISKRHVGIRKVAEGYELADLGSTNGVYVNGQKVPRRQLAPGDVIRVGVTEIVFRS